MTKETKTDNLTSNAQELIGQLKAAGCYFIPRGAIATDAMLAAAHGHDSHRTVVETFFFPSEPDREGVPAIKCGNRIVCTSDAIWEFVDQHAKPLERSKRGGNKRCGGKTPSKPAA